ncbi:hypothetical protein D3C81_1543880 [compost metagenome]
MAPAVVIAGDGYLALLAKQHGPPQHLRNPVGHFRYGPYQIERMLPAHLADAFDIVAPELLQILRRLRRGRPREVNQRLAGVLDPRSWQLPHHVQRGAIDQDDRLAGKQLIQVRGQFLLQAGALVPAALACPLGSKDRQATAQPLEVDPLIRAGQAGCHRIHHRIGVTVANDQGTHLLPAVNAGGVCGEALVDTRITVVPLRLDPRNRLGQALGEAAAAHQLG